MTDHWTKIEYGRKLMDSDIAHDFSIQNCSPSGDPKRAYTCYTHNCSNLVLINWTNNKVFMK